MSAATPDPPPAPALGVPTWSAPVRYAEVDQQGVVFNPHYLLYCDEAMGAFCLGRGLGDFVERVRLKRSGQTWHAAARWGDVVAVDARCTAVGRTSLTMVFEVGVGPRACCSVETVYVHTDAGGTPVPISEADRAALAG
ncbi:acyl-CoA thioester hydrolase [Jatrophihabitans endophyticus]|uniref:Acyl-CoA thioester hydrolase n=1 Tax=Jatrophihabitans endophyticus TaxID=1206085 RepID=A0A1M5SP05_9ACTN|nr:hotdog domain-containing protein [Jatrophihabitans endophyticus]SHH40269.1 acyl-CoA thioester hydrolase [Jatrophihabitans endophyticus]